MLLKQDASRKDNIDCYKGAGYYRIAYSDSGPNNGPVFWFDGFAQCCYALEGAWETATPTHLPYSVYLGVRLPLGVE